MTEWEQRNVEEEAGSGGEYGGENIQQMHRSNGKYLSLNKAKLMVFPPFFNQLWSGNFRN